MNRSKKFQTLKAVPQQGNVFGWTLWALLCLLTWFALSDARAASFIPGTITFGSTPVGSTSNSQVVTILAQASGTSASAVLLTEGVDTATLAEFALSGSGSCQTDPDLTQGQSCTVNVTFAPRLPGLRHGAVVLKTSGGQVLGTALISGLATGGLPVLVPGQINTVAGSGQWYYQGDGVDARQAPIYLPAGIVVDAAGNLYLADSINNRIRRVDAQTRNISTVAGNGTAGSSNDNGTATQAEVAGPTGLAMDGAGNLYIADSGNNTIRRVDAVTGNISTVAGTAGQAGYTGDGGPAVNATLNSPQGIAVDPQGNLIIADTLNSVIRLVAASDHRISTIAGTGAAGFNHDGDASTSQLNQPSGVAIRTDGAIAIADLNNNRVRLLTPDGTLTTIAGKGQPGYAGEGVDPAQALLQGPAAVAYDPAGDLFIADSVNNCVRLVYGSPSKIITLAGTPGSDGFAGDDGPEDKAHMHGPDALFFDGGGNLWLSDRFNNRVREVNGSLLTVGPYPTMKVGKTSDPIAETMLNAGNATLNLGIPALQQASLDVATTTCSQTALPVSGVCKMGLQFSPTVVDPDDMGSVTWGSDAPNVTPVDRLHGPVLSVEPTSVALTSNVNPGLLGQPIALTATVASADKNRTGSVNFVEGSTTWCSAVPLAADGTATCNIPSLSLGVHNFIANYSGDNNNAASQSDPFQETIKQQAALAISVSASPAVVTNNIVLSIGAADPSGTPTGTVIFFDGASPLQTVTLDANGNASWSTTSFSVGLHNLTAQYSGDGTNAPGTSNVITLEVDRANTVTVLSSGSSSATVGASVALTANVVSNGGPAPTGSVQFQDGNTPIGSAPLNSSGSASLAVNSLAPGTHHLVAVYSGDTDNSSSNSATITEQINQIGTVTTVGADADPLSAGGTVHFNALVQIAPGATADGSLAGQVTFTDGNVTLGTTNLNESGQATLAVGTLAVGTHSIVAAFVGSTNYAPSQSGSLAEKVQQTPATVTLSAAASSTLMGKPADFAASVSSATGVPTGTLTLKDGTTVIGTTAVDARGSASFSTTKLGVGTHTLMVVYSGDPNYLTAASSSIQVQVALAQPTVTLAAATSAVDAGLPARFTSELTTPGITPAGTLTLLDGPNPVATEPVATVGTFSFTTASLGVGVHHLTAKYSGDLNNGEAISAVVTVAIQQASTSTALVTSKNPLTRGQELVLTATVSSDSPSLSNRVNFFDGATVLGSVALGADGTATLSVQNMTLGLHSLKAVYLGDTNHVSSPSSEVPELVVQSSALSISSSVNPSVSGQNVVFTGQITGYPTPTGTLAFRDNGSLLATVSLDDAGQASFATSSLTVGAHTVSITYSGDEHFSTTSVQLSQNILQATTAITLSASDNPGTYGQALALFANIASNGSTATGKVAFTDRGVSLGSALLDASGRASFSTSTLRPGIHSITASYAGDGKAGTSVSQPLTLLVKQITTLSLGSDANPALTLSTISLRAAVNNAGAAVATGSVTFTEGEATLGTALLDGAGHANLAVPSMTAGTHTIAVSYAGDDANFASPAFTYKQLVQVRPTSTTLTGTGTDESNPQQMTLIAVVHGEGSTPPGGTVNFTSGPITLGAASVDATGVATITVIFSTPTQQITANYSGDASYGASQSAETPITAGTPAQFTIAVSNPAITLVSHQRTTINVTLASVKGFTDDISLGCLGLPYAATCTFSQSQLKLNANGTVTASLIVDTGDPLGAGTSVSASTGHGRNLLLCFTPASLLLVLLRGKGKRKRVPALLAMLLALALAGSGLTGCAGLQMSGTPAGNYSFRVIGTGKGSNATEAQTVTLVVTQ